MKNKNLFILFAILLAIYLGAKLFSNKTPDRSFEPELVKIDTTLVTKILLNTKADNQEEVVLEKTGTTWQATKGDISVVANSATVNALLDQLVLVKTKRVAAKKKDKWSDYELEEGKANRIRIYAGNELLKDVVVGRFDFNQSTRSATTFVRLSEEENVYAVDGFLSMAFGNGFNAYRNNALTKMRAEDILKVSLKNADQMIELTKNGSNWMSSNGQVLDSLKMANYLNALSTVKGSNFDDAFSNQGQDAFQTLTITGNNLREPIVLEAFKSGSEENVFFIKSNQNKEATFKSKSEEIYKTIFTNFTALF